MKKRYVDASRLRKMKKAKITEKISESAYTFLKFVMVWILVLLADFILEFRFEYLWPCWLFFGSVYTTFHCHGLKGLCMSTISLWILLVYTEASLRFKDLRSSHVNLIGYPVVYLGFDATCYLSSVVKLRTQRAVRTENDFHMRLLEQSLPPGVQLYPKCLTDGKEGSKWRAKPGSTQYLCQNGALPADESDLLDCLQIGGVQKRPDRDVEDGRAGGSGPLAADCEPRETPRTSGVGLGDTTVTSESPTNEEQGAKNPKTSKVPSPKMRRASNNSNSTVPSVRGDRKQKGVAKTVSPNRDMPERSPSANQSFYSDQITNHICNLTNSERSLRPEVSLLRQANDLLQNKILCLMKNKQKDKQTTALLEKKMRAEIEAHAAVEKQLAEVQSRKLDEASVLPHSALLSTNRQEHSETQTLKKKAKELETEFKHLQLEYQRKEGQTIALENEVEVLRKYKGMEQDADMLLSALSAMQDKTQHLEYNLSAETRIKLDLFSALGDARRQLEIAQGKLMKQDQEIGEMKQKIAEVMAVMPGISYTVPQPIVPQYLTKFLNSDNYRLDPSALMYQCLKK
ncbi:hypothetical protein JZ751_010318 [Albula glossodonta]|uniref:Macoilin n=1 Tax=Albula glossodonta TaxID=121402 RepID=A0A8T2NUK6_9TELE|nr:hypothetical protein JZ751_010318 [Albula glossodonta]